MDFEILLLGPIGLRVNGRHDPLGSAKERALLAAVAVDVGKAVSADTLTHRIWDQDPPGKPQASLHVYAARLRRRFRDTCGKNPLVQQAGTYALDVPPDHVDFCRYQQLTSDARAMGDQPVAAALNLLREAETLWRGEPLAGLTGAWAEQTRVSLDERHLDARLRRATLEQRDGRFADSVDELSALLRRQPAHETVAEHLMIALHGCGRSGDALRVFATVQKLLREEFGADAGESISRIHRLILHQTPATEIVSPPEPAPADRSLNNLPAHGEIVGRGKELSMLQASPPPGTVIALQSISGMAGVGKSLLAFHAARKLARSFPEGQIYIDLRAHSARRGPLTPSAALAALLRTMGMPSKSIPLGLEERIALWRDLLKDRRAVIILDDAATPEQVRPLLPLGSPSLVLITSRHRLTGVPGARPVFLDVLPTREAAQLFTRLVGNERVSDSAEVASIVDLCGQLPLAIELAAGRLCSRPAWTVHHLAQKLSQSGNRLDEIRDGTSGIKRAFELSYRTLTPAQQAAFRRLGLHFGASFGPHAAAALNGTTVDSTEHQLEALLGSNLLTEPEPDRYRFHDLLGEYAVTLAHADPGEESAALQRLTEFYLAAAQRADAVVNARRIRVEARREGSAHQLPVLREEHDARGWFLTEASALIATEHHARTHGSPRQAAELAHALAPFLEAEGLWDEAEHMHRHAAHHWSRTGDTRAEALARIELSVAHGHAARYPQAAAAAQQALALARSAGDLECAAESLNQLGILHWHRGEYHEMLQAQREALEIWIRTGATGNQARTTNNIGIAHLHLGNSAAAFRHFQEALLAFREIGNARGEAQALNNLADAYLHAGDRSSARMFFSRSLEIALKSGSRSEQAMAQLNLGNTLTVPEEMDEVLGLYEKALASFQRLGDRRNETITRIALGEALAKAGRYEESLELHTRSLTTARAIGAGLEEAQALRGLGTAEHHLGRPASACRHLDAALELAARIHSPEEEARARDALAELHLAGGRPEAAKTHWEYSIGIFKDIDETESHRLRRRLSEAQHLRE